MLHSRRVPTEAAIDIVWNVILQQNEKKRKESCINTQTAKIHHSKIDDCKARVKQTSVVFN